jgi:hypothetical protein
LEDLILLILLKITYLCILWKVLGWRDLQCN